jgi:hypothetical protein
VRQDGTTVEPCLKCEENSAKPQLSASVLSWTHSGGQFADHPLFFRLGAGRGVVAASRVRGAWRGVDEPSRSASLLDTTAAVAYQVCSSFLTIKWRHRGSSLEWRETWWR